MRKSEGNRESERIERELKEEKTRRTQLEVKITSLHNEIQELTEKHSRGNTQFIVTIK